MSLSRAGYPPRKPLGSTSVAPDWDVTGPKDG